jgi:hypothetical protein
MPLAPTTAGRVESIEAVRAMVDELG